MLVDYGLSELEVASKLVVTQPFSKIFNLLEALELSHQSSAIQTLIQQRSGCLTVPSHQRLKASTSSTYEALNSPAGRIAEIHETGLGGLVAGIKRNPEFHGMRLQQSVVEEQCNEAFGKGHSTADFETFWVEAEAVAVVPPGCQIGDILMQYFGHRNSNSETPFLILRKDDGNTYRVFGRGFLLRGYCFCRSDWHPCNCYAVHGEKHVKTTAKISLQLTAEDVVLLLATDSSSHGELELVDRLRLLSLPVTLHPDAMATLTDLRREP